MGPGLAARQFRVEYLEQDGELVELIAPEAAQEFGHSFVVAALELLKHVPRVVREHKQTLPPIRLRPQPVQQVGGAHPIDERADARFRLLQSLGKFGLRAAARQRVADDLQHGVPRVTQAEFCEMARQYAPNPMGRPQNFGDDFRRFRVNGFRLPGN